MSLEMDESSSGTSSSSSVSIQSFPSLSSYASATTYSALRKEDSNVTTDTVVTKDTIVTTTVAPVPEIQPIVSDCPPWLHDVGIGELPKAVVSSDGLRIEFVSAPCNSKVNYRSFNCRRFSTQTLHSRSPGILISSRFAIYWFGYLSKGAGREIQRSS